ncbi:anthranilate synthase component II [Aquibacillus sediminis]|uniref:anthranilate synthase component II n=1 Tax=Aquibacillus sediminis TaxID=2574734 RepID=UPI00110820B2|nr:aminodeoxychorismate/anthranilate synthase component II [Aquibacillus sediminis]
MIVVIDNYDSFTYNLVQYFKMLDNSVFVYQNNQVTIEKLNVLKPSLIVLSPGPGTPAESGVCKDVVEHFKEDIPILGVCLGHQLIVTYFGGIIRKGKQPMHGKVSKVVHNQLGVYENIPSPTQVTRYHSLIADEENLPNELIVNARSEDGTIMGVVHQTLPITGIQFHPESILTTDGFTMLKNCYTQAIAWKKQQKDWELLHESVPSI